jgi:hypothetical protein
MASAPVLAPASAPGSALVPVPASTPLPELPRELILRILRITRLDADSRLQLSQDTRQALLSPVRRLELRDRGDAEKDVGALVHLLERTTNLHRLGMASLNPEHSLALMHALRDGAGLLPNVTELRLLFHEGVASALADALEARRDNGLPPVTHLEEVFGIDVITLRRIWACCPPDKVTHLEAVATRQLEALGEYMLAYPNFVALRYLDVGGDYDEEIDEDNDGMDAYLEHVLQALAQGHAPNLETLKFTKWDEGPSSLATLGEAIAQGMLPNLSCLVWDATTTYSVELSLILGVLQTTGALRALQIQWELEGTPFETRESVSRLAEVLTAGVGLTHLEILELSGVGRVGGNGADLILGALSGGAPCSRTLKSLDLNYLRATERSAFAFFRAMRRGRFPSLTTLVLWGDRIGDDLVRRLAKAFLVLAASNTPSRLKILRLTDVALTSKCLDAQPRLCRGRTTRPGGI